MIDWILAGLAGTYLHKKFPKQTEAVAKGILKTTEFVARKAYDAISKSEGQIIEGRVAIDTASADPRRQLTSAGNGLAKRTKSWYRRTG